MIKSYKELIVWNKALKFSTKIYKLSSLFPKEEIYGLTSQIRRAATSIPLNIAEGSCRGTRKEFGHFLRMAYGSGAEVETLLEIIKQLPFGGKLNYNDIEGDLSEIMKILNSLIGKISAKN